MRSKSYLEECECIRMVNISQSLGMPTIFIRYNPDSYIINKKTHNPSSNRRKRILHNILNNCIDKNVPDIQKLGFLSMIHIFYDGYTEDNPKYI